MRWGRLWGCFLVFLLLLTTVSAEEASFAVSISPESRSISLQERATFDLTIENLGDTNQLFDIYSPNVAWDITTLPTEDRTMEIAAGGVKTTKLVVRPLYVGPGSYGVEINVKSSKTQERVQKIVRVGIYSKDQPRDYLPSVFTKVELPRTVDPREPIPITLLLKNQNIKPIEKIDLKLRSQLLNKDHTTSLEPLEEKRVKFHLSINENTEPLEDVLETTVFAFADGKIYQFDVEGVPFSISTYGDITKDTKTVEGFLTKEVHVAFENTGNVEKDATHSLVVDLLNRPFIEGSPNPILKDSPTGTQYTWTFTLSPGEKKSLVISYNYRPLLYFILIIILGFIVYGFYRTPLIVRKAAMVVQKKEGGISEIKVIINLRNRTKKAMYDVEVIDLVPTIASVLKKEEAGALPPTKILKNKKKGTLIKWHIGMVDPNEDRMISYRIRTNLSILGEFTLPAVLVTYKSNIGPGTRSIKSPMESLFGR